MRKAVISRQWSVVSVVSLLLAIFCLESFVSAQAIAARRYAEPTVLQMPWTSTFSTVAPFNNVSGYTTITQAQAQPSALVTLTDNCSSTSNYTITREGGTPTFSVSGNQCVLTTAGAQGATLVQNSSSFTVPSLSVQMTVNQVGTSTGYETVGASISNGTVEIDAQIDCLAAKGYIDANVSGTDHTLTTVTGVTCPATPWNIMLVMTGNVASLFMQSTGGWNYIGQSTVATYHDFQAVGGLSGFKAGWQVYAGSAATWKVSNLSVGAFGGVGFRDVTLARYPDGRVYMQGSKEYMTANLAPLANTGDSNSSCGILTYDLVSGILTQIGQIWNTRSGEIYGDDCEGIVYDPSSGTERLIASTWPSESTTGVFDYYGSFNTSSQNFLAGGVFLVSMTEMTLPSTGTTCNSSDGCGWYDAWLFCPQWNYSINSCPTWYLAYVTSPDSKSVSPGGTFVATSAGDPSANSWSYLGALTSANYEWNGVIRTATGSSGVQYWLQRTALSGQQATLYSPTLSFLGTPNYYLSFSSLTIGGQQIGRYGPSLSLLSYDSTQFASIANTHGDALISPAPAYPPAQEVTYVAETGSTAAASITSPSVHVQPNLTYFLFCRTTYSSSVTISPSSSATATWTTDAQQVGTSVSPNVMLAHAIFSAAGNTTFTCTPSSSLGYQSMTVMAAPNVTGLNAGSTSSGTLASGATSLTSGSWSTSGTTVGVYCVSASATTNYFYAGLMAGSQSAVSGYSGANNGSADSGCEVLQMPGAVSSQTAAMSWVSSVGATGVFAAYNK